jgi:hypothetical protein
MDKIDLDAIMDSKNVDENGFSYDTVKWLMKETARQALVLASEKAVITRELRMPDGSFRIGTKRVSKQSILDVEKLIV